MAGASHGQPRKPLPQRLRGLPALSGRAAAQNRGAWIELAQAARLAAASPESVDAAFDLAGARNAVRGKAVPTRGMAGQGAGRALLELTAEWPEQGLARRLMFAPAVEAAAELVARLMEEAALSEAAFSRRMCGED